MTRTNFGDQLQQMWQTRPIRLPRHGPIAGVCAGVGHRYGIDPVLVRVAFVVSTIFGGAGIVLYLAGWLLFPEPGERVSMAESLTRKRQDSQNQTKTIVLIVALAIAVSTMGPMGVGLGGSGVIALALMLAGWWMLYLRTPQPPPLPDSPTAPGPLTAPGSTGYPGAAFPQGGMDSYPAQPSGLYTPYTKLPDHYVPDSPPGAAAPNIEDESAAGSTEEAGGNSTAAGEATVGPQLTKGSVGPQRTDDTAISAEPDSGQTTEPSPSAAPVPPAASAVPVPPATSTFDAAGNAVGAAATADPSSDTGAVPAGSPAPGPDKLSKRAPAQESHRTVDMHKPSGTGTADRTPPSWDPLGAAPMAWDLPEPTPDSRVAAPVEKRPRSRFTPIVLGLALLAAAGAGAAAVAGIDAMTPGRIAAIALAVVGLGLMVGAFRRRGYGLLSVTAPLAAFVILATAIGPIDFDRTAVGERTWAPASATEIRPEYTIDMGSATLDLRGIELTEDKTVEISVRMGEAVVQVPENMNVRTECTVRMGQANCPDGLSGPGGDAPVLNLNVQVSMGEAEVHRG